MGWVCLVVHLALIGPAPGAGEGPTVSVFTASGEAVEGRLISWDPDGRLTLVKIDGDLRRWSMDEIERVEVAAGPPRRPSGAWLLRTRRGSRLFADITAGDESKVFLSHRELGRLAFPLDELDAVVRRGASPSILPTEKRSTQDLVVLANGDVIRGTITRLGREQAFLFRGEDESRLSLKLVRAILFASPVHLAGATHVFDLRLVDGSQLKADRLVWTGDEVRAVLTGGQSCAFKATSLIAVEVVGTSRIWLTDLTPASYESVAFLERAWPLKVGKNAVGGPLRITGRAYERGLGLHSACRLTWRLGGAYERLTALVGIDDSAGPWADADLAVFVDGKGVVHLQGLRHGAAPQPIDVELGGAKELRIEVGFGRNGHVQDRVNLVNPALIRATKRTPSTPPR